MPFCLTLLSQSVDANAGAQCPAITDDRSLPLLVAFLADDNVSRDERFECAQRAHTAAASADPSLRFQIAEAWAAGTFHMVPALEAGGVVVALQGLQPDLSANTISAPRRAVYTLALLLLSQEQVRAIDAFSSQLEVARRRQPDPNPAVEAFQRYILARAEARLGLLRTELGETELASLQLRRSLEATREWLALMPIPRKQEELLRVVNVCRAGEDTPVCPLRAVALALRALDRTLTEPPTGSSPYYAAMRHYDSAMTAVGDGQWLQAMESYALGAALLEREADPRLRELAGNFFVGAANLAVLSGDCAHGRDYANRAIGAVQGQATPGLHGPIPSQARTLIAECHLVEGRYGDAWTIARQAIGEEPALRNARAGLDLRQRFRLSDRAISEPREIAMLSGAMRYESASPAEQTEIFDALVRYSAELRNSSLSDAIRLQDQRRRASGEHRAAIEALLEANGRMDGARRALRDDDEAAEANFSAVLRELNAAEARAREQGVALDSTDATFATLRSALQDGEGLIHFQNTPYGRAIWGIDGRGQRFVLTAGLHLPRPNESEGERLTRRLTGDPILYVISGNQRSNYITTLSSLAAANRLNEFRPGNPYVTGREPYPPDNPRSVLTSMLMSARDDFLEPIIPALPRATRWVISYSNTLDEMPWAQLPMGNGDFFGLAVAYSITPSLDAFLVLRRADIARPHISAPVFAGIGGIRFTGRPCTPGVRQAAATGDWPDDYLGQRGRIIGQPCLEGTDAQLRDMAQALGSRTPTLFLGADATEGNLASRRGMSPTVLAIISHAVTARSGFGDAPAILLNPPERPRNPGDDGRLQPLEAAGLAMDADVVVLSACSTGVADRALGEEALSGMTRGFFLGGARAVLTTRWTIRLSISRVMNAEFARSLARGSPRAIALRDARRAATRMPGVMPWDWAAFELVGEGGFLP
jgi:tetratricopeptide (TPR) repeat protein